MAPRFMERMQRQSDVLKVVYGEPQFDPPPYPFSRGRSESEASATSHLSSQSQQSPHKPLPSPPPPQYQVNRQSMSSFDKPALPRDSLILVTGANGFQGMHIVDQLLERGYRVRGTVRNAEKAVWTSDYFKNKYAAGRFTTAIIPDMVPQGAFDIAARGCAGIIHVASVMNFSSDPNEVITPSIAGALNALEAAMKEPNVKRFVYCSATAAAVSQGTAIRNDVTNESWNMASFKAAWEEPPYEHDRAWAVFSSSKMQTEQAVWRWYHRNKPMFALNTVLPNTLFGRILEPQHQGHPSSVAILKLMFDGNPAATAWAPPQYFVDVQDSALLHVAALILPDVRGERIFAASLPYNINSIMQLLRMLYPDRVFEGDVSDHGVDLTIFKQMPKAEALLKRMGRDTWTDIETSIGNNCESFF